MAEVERVAVLGTGIMGAPMARNLLSAGFDVAVWNRTREKAEALAGDGAMVASTPAEAVSGADVALTMLTDGDAVEQVVIQAIDAFGDDAIWIQTSTVGIAATERLANLAGEHRVPFVDAPVLGTKQPAEEGKLLVLASGPEELRERCEPVFDALGTKSLWLGEAGNGTRLKLVLNTWLLALVEGTAETIALAEALGLDPRQVLETIEGTAVDSAYLQMKGKAILDGELSPSFPLRLALKDAELVLEAAEEAGIELPLPRTARDQLRRAADLGHADEDMAATYYASGSVAAR